MLRQVNFIAVVSVLVQIGNHTYILVKDITVLNAFSIFICNGDVMDLYLSRCQPHPTRYHTYLSGCHDYTLL